MPMKIESQEDGSEIEVYTAEEKAAEIAKIEAEYQAKLAEKDEHLKKKTEEFVQGKKSIEFKNEENSQEWNSKIEEAKKKADEAAAIAEAERNARLTALRDFAFEQYGGSDPETKKKLMEAWEVVNIPMDTDENIRKRAQYAANLAGISAVSETPKMYGASFSGGYAPTFKRDEGLKDEDHNRFKQELGLDHIIPKTENK